jgi:hypothetical protein
VFVLLYGALLAWQIDRWLFTPHGIVSTWAERSSGATVSAGSPAGVSQTFLMGADGLDGVWLRPTVTGGEPRGELLVDLSLVRDGFRVRLERVVLPARDVPRHRSLHVPFAAVRASRGVRFAIDIRHLHGEAGGTVALAASREDRVRDGRLFADGVEQWGDLVFETSSRRATLPYWLAEILRPWPAWVRSWPAVALALLSFNGLLAWASARATGLVGEASDAPVRRARSASFDAAVTGRLALLATCLVAAAGILVTVPATSVRAIRLVEHVPDARLESNRPIHEVVSVEPTVFFGRIYKSLITLPPAVLEWTIDVPLGAVFVTGAAERADLWERVSDGFSMNVEIVHDGRTDRIAHFGLYPFGLPAHRNLHRAEVSLQPWAGRRVVLRLIVEPGPTGNRVNDVPVWADPMIRWQSHAYGGVVRADGR